MATGVLLANSTWLIKLLMNSLGKPTRAKATKKYIIGTERGSPACSKNVDVLSTSEDNAIAIPIRVYASCVMNRTTALYKPNLMKAVMLINVVIINE